MRVAVLEEFSLSAGRWAARAGGRAQVHAGRPYSIWVAGASRSAPGWVHEQVKGEAPPPSPPAMLETAQLGDAVADPVRQMRLRERTSGAVWRSPAFDEAKLEG